MMQLQLNDWAEHSLLADAVNSLIDDLSNRLTDSSGEGDLNGVAYVCDRLIYASMLKERLAAVQPAMLNLEDAA